MLNRVGGFKRQRFRWTYGPIQELKRHLRLFLPRTWRMASPSALTPVQKLLHLNHGLDRMNVGLQFLVVLEAEGAIKKWRTLMGATDPAKADAGTLRKDFGSSIERNATHGSDAPETAAFELGYFFRGMEML